MSQLTIQQLSNGQYRVTWTPTRTVKQYRFLVGTDPGLDNVYNGATEPGNQSNSYTEIVPGNSRMWIQVEYMSNRGMNHTAPQQLP